MSYELFRADFASRLPSILPDPSQMRDILLALDSVAASYDVSMKCTDLIVSDGLPDAVRLYLASKAVDNLTKGTLENYYNTLRIFFQRVRKSLENVTANDVRLYLHNYKLERHVKDNTLENIRIQFNSFFEWCVDEGFLPKNPIRKKISIRCADPERLPMSALELEKVRGACRGLREKAIVDFLYSSACRVSEFTALKKEDIDWTEHTVRIHHGKGDKARTTFMNPEAEISLRAYLDSRMDDDEALFVTKRRPYHRMCKKSVEDEIKRIVSRVDLSVKVTPHVFRHTAASLALQRGMPIEQVQKFLGHARIQTTLRYAKILDFDVRLAHGKYVA